LFFFFLPVFNPPGKALRGSGCSGRGGAPHFAECWGQPVCGVRAPRGPLFTPLLDLFYYLFISLLLLSVLLYFSPLAPRAFFHPPPLFIYLILFNLFIYFPPSPFSFIFCLLPPARIRSRWFRIDRRAWRNASSPKASSDAGWETQPRHPRNGWVGGEGWGAGGGAAGAAGVPSVAMDVAFGGWGGDVWGG